MTTSQTGKLETVLENLSIETWNRLNNIKAFLQRPEPFNSVRLGETTITDLAMMELCRQGLSRSLFLQTPAHKEKFWGTDFEWWLGSDATGWFRLAVQAKKLDMKQDRYLTLTHDANGMLQIDALEAYADRNRATPLYCLYNFSSLVDPDLHWHCCQRCPKEEELGCSITHASRIREAINTWGMRTFEFVHEWTGTVPWQCLASCHKVREALRLGRMYPSDGLFPLLEPRSYYPELPPFLAKPVSDRLVGLAPEALVDDGMAGYDFEIVTFNDLVGEYYNPSVGVPRAINVISLDN